MCDDFVHGDGASVRVEIPWTHTIGIPSAQRTIQRVRIVCVMHAAARTNRRALSVPGRQGSTTPPQREQGCGERGRAGERADRRRASIPRSGVMRRAHGGRPGAGTTGTAPKRTTASRCELANRQAFRGRTATRVNPSPRASGATVDRSAVGPFGLGVGGSAFFVIAGTGSR